MMSFYLSGGVEVLGFISPTEPTDEYPVIDPLYGIDGFRNVNTLSDLNSIPNLRRRAGMVVGVSGGTQYYKLNPSPWAGTITDWDTFSLGGGAFTGGTVTGDTIFTQGVTATTFSASTYLGLPLDIYTTGFTFNPSTYDISIERNDGVTLTQNLGILATDVTITGGTYDPLNGSITFVNNTGGTFTVSGFITGFTDIQVTSYTYQDNTFTISDSSGNTFSATIDVMTGLTVNGLLSATTLNVNGVNITGDTYTTGGTYSNGTLDFYNNTGGSYQVTGLYTGQTSYVNSLTTGVGLSGDSTTGNVTIINTDPDQIVSISGGTGILTGGTYPNFTIENSLPDQTVVLNNGTNISVTGTYPNFTIDVTGLTDNNTYTTGFTYQDNTFTISDSSGNTFSATIDVMTGLTVNGILSATTISGGTLYGDGSNLTGLSTGLNVGTTQITNGTSGRVLFQSGTTLQQDANFVWDNTNKRLGIGTTPSVELDVNGRFNFYQTNNGKGRLSLINNTGTGNFLTFTYTAVGYPGTSMFNAGVGFNFVGGNNYHGEITLARTAPSGLITTRIGASNDSYLSESNLVIGATTAGARLDVRAQGALSTDIAFRVRNSADTANLVSVQGNNVTVFGSGTADADDILIRGIQSTTNYFKLSSQGGVAIGSGSTISASGSNNTAIAIGLSSSARAYFGLGGGVAIGQSTYAESQAIAIGILARSGYSAGGSTSKTIAIGYNAQTNAQGGNRGIAIGSDSSGGFGNFDVTSIGTSVAMGSFTSARNTFIGQYITGANGQSDMIVLGGGTGTGVSAAQPTITSSFSVYLGNTQRSFFVNKNSNIVIRSLGALTPGTHFEAAATNTFTIHNGTAPVANIADAYTQYSADIIAGNAAPHFRTENGSIIKLYTHSAVTTTQEIANALTTLGLLSASTISPSTDYYVTGGTYDFTGDTLTLERNDGNQVQITGFTYERQSDYVYPYFYGGSAPVYTLTSTSTWVIKRVDYTTPGSPVIQQAIGSWDDRYILTYT
jgi:hypothetical protein